ncbi:hypothetical protein GCM10022214_11590 [Actinomadura miaoliensis]|uniref:Uncharacterized protein n=1 Tax=Actinomadura miaoliensis TaxID=430685 RepID=A0ABP7V6I8_9ACTN
MSGVLAGRYTLVARTAERAPRVHTAVKKGSTPPRPDSYPQGMFFAAGARTLAEVTLLSAAPAASLAAAADAAVIDGLRG